MNRAFCSFGLLLVTFLSVSSLSAQESEGVGIFPFTMVLEAAEYAVDGNKTWRPDWPAVLPPDAFRTVSGQISRITVERDGSSFVYGFDSRNWLEEFPFMLNGDMAQVKLVYGENEIQEVHVNFPSPPEEITEDLADAPANDSAAGNTANSWKMEFLEQWRGFNQSQSPYKYGSAPVYAASFSDPRDLFPVLIRVSHGEDWYFIYLYWGTNEITETWYDVDGRFLGAFVFSLIEVGNTVRISGIRDLSGPDEGYRADCYYDSRGFLTESTGSGGKFVVQYYRDDQIRYWERRPGIGEEGKITLQWDQGGFLSRMYGEGISGNAYLDCRYEYILDEEGNWIERREVQMIRHQGFLVPAGGAVVRRNVEYRIP